MSSTARIGAVALALAAAVLIFALWRSRETPEAALPILGEGQTKAAEFPVLVAEPRDERTALLVEPTSPAVAEPVDDVAAREREAEPTPLPIGVVEILVLRGDAPVDGGWVHIHSGGSPWLPRDPVERDVTIPIGSDGIAHATGLSLGKLSVGAEVEPGIVHQRRITLPETEGARLIIRLGAARVRGHAYDDEGTPVEGARVQVSSVEGTRPAGAPVSKQHTVVVWTGADGAYDVPSLPAGFTWVSANFSGIQRGPGRKEMLSIQLEEGETRVVDFGRSARTPVWSGTVRNRAGEPVPNYGPPGTTGALHFVSAATDGYRTVTFQEDGSFRVLLLPGTYEVRVNPPSRRDRELLFEAFVMEDGDLAQDVTIGGTRVTGTVVRASTGEALVAGNGRAMQVGLRESADRGPEFGGRLGPDGTYTIDGVEPGTWLVATYPRQLTDEILVIVAPGDLTVRQDLAVE